MSNFALYGLVIFLSCNLNNVSYTDTTVYNLVTSSSVIIWSPFRFLFLKDQLMFAAAADPSMFNRGSVGDFYGLYHLYVTLPSYCRNSTSTTQRYLIYILFISTFQWCTLYCNKYEIYTIHVNMKLYEMYTIHINMIF